MQLLVTGAAGKVGQAFLEKFLAAPRWKDASVVVLCHNRTLAETDRLTVVQGSIADPTVAQRAMSGVTHVIHLATVKEDPISAMDVSVKGLFQLLEGFRQNPLAEQFLLLGGDCVVGHCVVKWEAPVTEFSPFRPYPGVYALSKVLEETMLTQFGIQYGLNWTTLRAPWIMEKDDFRYALSFGDDQFGGPAWTDFITDDERRQHYAANRTPLMMAADGRPLKRNFIHLDDLVEAILLALDHPASHQQLFNVAMTDPVDYGLVAEHLRRTRAIEPVEIATGLHSNALDSTKARLRLGWAPKIDSDSLIDRAFDYVRPPEDRRKVWYAG